MFSLNCETVKVGDLKQFMLYNLNDLNYINNTNKEENYNENNSINKPSVSKNLIYNNL